MKIATELLAFGGDLRLPGLSDLAQAARVVDVDAAGFSQVHGEHLGRDDGCDWGKPLGHAGRQRQGMFSGLEQVLMVAEHDHLGIPIPNLTNQ